MPNPLRLCSFESRRAADMQSLIERHGGIATVVPSMRELPLDENEAALDFARRLLKGEIDIVVFMTGVGAQSLLDAVETQFDREQFLTALNACQIAVRGPKPTAVLHKWGTHIDCKAPSPNTWHELLSALDAELPVAGKRVAVQEYGEPNNAFYDELRSRSAEVIPVPVYRWAFPTDIAPLTEAVQQTIAGQFDVLVFTSAFQLSSVLHAADQAGLRDDWITAANNITVASIGPTATEKLRSEGLQVDIEADPPKMGQLVRAIFAEAPQIMAEKHQTG